MKTLAEFKRDAATGKMSLELVERFGSTNIIERLQGIRKISKVRTAAVVLVNQNGSESELRFDSAKLVDYDGESLTIYSPGKRELTDEEKSVLAEWKKIQEEYEQKNPYSDTYWRKKAYFSKSSCPWLEGFGMVRGKMYQNDGYVLDNAVKGDAILKYKVYMEA